MVQLIHSQDEQQATVAGSSINDLMSIFAIKFPAIWALLRRDGPIFTVIGSNWAPAQLHLIDMDGGIQK